MRTNIFGESFSTADMIQNGEKVAKLYDDLQADYHKLLCEHLALQRKIISTATEKLSKEGLFSDETAGMSTDEALEYLKKN